MFLSFNKSRNFDFEKFFSGVSVFAGFIFFICEIYYLTANFSLDVLISQFQKITFQSNLLGFIVSTLYFFNPEHRIFYRQTFMLMACVMLLFAGLGFWILLFPIYFIDLGDFLVVREQYSWHIFSFFQLIWNHSITPCCFLMLFYFAIKKTSNVFLAPISKKKFNKCLSFYIVIWVSLNAIISFWDRIFPTYGIMTNFNWNTKWMVLFGNKQQPLFDIRVLIFSHMMCLSLLKVLGGYFYGVINDLSIPDDEEEQYRNFKDSFGDWRDNWRNIRN